MGIKPTCANTAAGAFRFMPLINNDISSWNVEGPFDSSYSLSILNRCFAEALKLEINSLFVHNTEGYGDYLPNIEYLKQYTKRDVISLKWVYFRLAELAEFQNQRVQAAIYYGEVKRIDPNWSGVSKKIKELSQ